MIIKPVKRIAAIYRCPKCRQEHQTEKAALACANTLAGKTPEAKPGDIVLMYPSYGWHDGRPEWVIREGPEAFHGRKLFHFWWVITHVDEGLERYHPHTWRYHVATKAVNNGMKPCLHGWTGGRHLPFTLAENPPRSIVDDAQDLIGLKSEHLL